MSKSITIADELHKKLASYGNRDESYNTILLRLLNNVDEEEAKEDRENRKSVFERGEGNEERRAGNSSVKKLEDGTTVRWKIERGNYAGESKTGTVKGGRVEYRGSTWSPTGFAREADKDIRGDDVRPSGSYRGPKEVEYRDEHGNWVSINTVLES